jgi:Arc/MetJ-type ribon-helix-helix transcriptional regulator
MAQLSIDLPDALTAYLQSQIAAGHYTDLSNYIETLIQQDLNHKTRLEQRLLESLDSPTSPMIQADWDNIRQIVRQNISAGGDRA